MVSNTGAHEADDAMDFLQNLVEVAASAAAAPAASTAITTAESPNTWIPRGNNKRTKISKPTTAASLHSPPKAVRTPSALFRPAKQVKKQTRPSLASLYSELQLTPENFVACMDAAKVFMLDPAYPERRNCIGSRTKGDNVNMKLELTKLTTRFLDEGSGSRFFGPDSDPPGDPNGTFAQVIVSGSTDQSASVQSQDSAEHHTQDGGTIQRDFVWPSDKDEIVKRCIKLLRKVASNEKQRVYALESRRPARNATGTSVNNGKDSASKTPPTTENITIRIFPRSSGSAGEVVSKEVNEIAAVWAVVVKTCSEQERVSDGATDPSLDQCEKISGQVHVQTSDGLRMVDDEASCMEAVEMVLNTPWLERIVRVVVRDPAAPKLDHSQESE
ncbi:hypothetical protein BDZ85DRAFT_17617 [Elsinoe ampelina]|uniref:Uncharacterized protein n=1 Tax=Elsinoe ampelina TaxID=302913 RepID=A0A6A6G7B6_9PEZI|nr:hypothetical protein BDZ85DRAFT_17617 [Elsinoe ampelina]